MSRRKRTTAVATLLLADTGILHLHFTDTDMPNCLTSSPVVTFCTDKSNFSTMRRMDFTTSS